MRWAGTLGGAPRVLLIAASAAVMAAAALGAAPAIAAPAAGGAATTADGWVVDRVRFEPLDAQPLEVAGTGAYRGAIDVVPGPEGVAVINEVGLEDYVRGISEVPPTWPAEAQKAQAIAARTYALWEWSRTVNATYKNLGADICATDACQVYRGVARERQENAEGWLAAVESTAGRAIYWRDAPIKAMYSSSNGGLMVAGAEPYLRAGVDPDDRHSPLHRWKATYDLRDVVAAAGLPLATVAVHRDGDTVWALQQAPADAPAFEALTAADFRKRLIDNLAKAEGLPLSLPTVRFGMHTEGADGRGGGRVVVEGIGWGHAIGMSQWGAYGKALRRMKADDILAAYYAGLRSVRVPEARLPATLKVAVDMGSPAASIAPEAGRFRVVAGDGTVLAHEASGAWRVVPATPATGGAPPRVRVTPPVTEAGAVPAGVVSVEPAAPTPGEPVIVRLSLPRAAAVTVVAAPPGTTAVPLELGVIGPGEIEQTLPAAAAPGAYQATVHTDPGGGRVAETDVLITVADPTSVVAAQAAAGPVRGETGRLPAGPVGLASVALGAVVAAALRLGRRHLPRLH